jgi:hypothetical protein
MVPEKHPSMSTFFKHLEPHETPPGTDVPSGCSTAPSMQAIIVNCVSIVNPQLAPIIGYELEMVMACVEYSHAASPTYSKVIAPMEARPFGTCVAIVHIVAPPSHVRLATIQILAPTTLTKVERILHEETSAISGAMTTLSHTTRTHNSPSVSSVATMVSEEHTGSTAMLKHLKSHETPPSTNMSFRCPTAPAMQSVIVNCVLIVNPQLAPIIGDQLEVVVSCPEDSQAACPAHSEVITASESGPSATCVAVVHGMAPTSHIRPAPAQILAPPALTEPEGVLPEKTSPIRGAMATMSPATCYHNSPSVSSVGTSVPEQHASMTTMLKHFKSHNGPPGAEMPRGFAVAPAMQAVIVDGVTIIDPQLTAIIGDNAEPVVARLEDSQAACPTHSEVITS